MKFIKLSEIFPDIKIGGTPSRAKQEYFGGGLPWVSIRDLGKSNLIIETKETLSILGVEKSNVKLIKEGALLFSFKLTVGTVAFAGVNLYTNEAIASFEPGNPQIDLRYLYYCLPIYAKKNARTNNYGAPLLNKEIIKNMEIPLPSLEEQKSIVAKLDKLIELIDLKKEAIGKTEELTKSVFLDIFGDPALNQKEWEIKNFSSVCIEITDGRNKTPEYVTTGYPVIRTTNVKSGYFDYSDLKYTTEKDFLIWTKRIQPKIGDIIYTREAPLGNCALISDDKLEHSCLGQRVMIARLNPEIVNSNFANHILNMNFCREQAEKMAGGSTIKHIRVGDLGKLKIISPPIPLQSYFAQIVEKNQGIIEKQKQSLQKLQELYNTTAQEIFN